MIVKADLHNHLRTRSDMYGLFNPAIDKAKKRLGARGILGVVNFDDRRYEDFVDQRGYDREKIGRNAIYVPEKDILVVKGQEVPTNDGHILVIGLNYGVHLKRKMNLSDTLKNAADENGIIILDHPFYRDGVIDYFRNNVDELRKISGIEIHNGEAAFGFRRFPVLQDTFPYGANENARIYYNDLLKTGNRYRIGALSFSDGHSIYEIGRSYTNLNIELPNRMLHSYLSLKRTDDLNKRLESAVRIASPSDCVMKDAKFGALDHALCLAPFIVIDKIKSRIFGENKEETKVLNTM